MLYIFWATLIFFLSLWIINPGNYIVAAGFIGLIIIYYYRTKDFRLSLLLAYIASLIVFTGKRYLIELIPPGIFPKEIFPEGFIAFFIVSAKHVLASMMFLVWLRDLFIKGKELIKFKTVDLLVVGFFIWVISSGLFGSKRPEVSLLFDISALHSLVLYIYLRTYITKQKDKFLPLLVGLFASLVIFESLISFQQFLVSSPIFKNLEIQVDIEYFGNVPDESQFTFRPVGTFEHANILGMWMSFWLVVIFSYLFKDPKPLLFSIFLLGTTTLVLTLSRSSWLGFGLGLFFVLFVLEKVKKIKPPAIFTKHFWRLFLAGFVLFVFFVLPRAEKSLYTLGGGGGYLRFLQIEESLNLIRRNPLFGVGTLMSVSEGLNLNPSGVYSAVALGVHNWYLLIASENGIPAIAFFLAFVIASFRKNLYSILREKISLSDQFIKLGFLGGIFSLMIVGIFQPFVGQILILLSFGIMGQDK